MSWQKSVFKVLSVLFLLNLSSVYSKEHSEAERELDVTSMIMHHISDSHDFHIADWNGHAISFPLPIILWTDNGLVTFLSSEFHHNNDGTHIVERGGQKFLRYHGQIYYAQEGSSPLLLDKEQHPQNQRPWDFSVTKNVFTLFLVALLMFLVFVAMARSYRRRGMKAPRGGFGFLEAIVVFIRDEIAIPNIGRKKYERYMPYLLTIFFLIWFLNLFGLIPFFPFAGTLSNDILFTGFLACVTLLITLFSGNKNYWKHIFATPGVPVWLYPIIIPVELLGILTKPFSLMIRLFANITAGHIIILSLVSLVFVFGSYFVLPISVGFSLFINVVELLVAVLQAYIFTLLSALYIGQAVEEEHH